MPISIEASSDRGPILSPTTSPKMIKPTKITLMKILLYHGTSVISTTLHFHASPFLSPLPPLPSPPPSPMHPPSRSSTYPRCLTPTMVTTSFISSTAALRQKITEIVLWKTERELFHLRTRRRHGTRRTD